MSIARKPTSIPSTAALPREVRAVVDPIKENLEVLQGQRGTKLARLGPTASTAEIINYVNSLADLLQGKV